MNASLDWGSLRDCFDKHIRNHPTKNIALRCTAIFIVCTRLVRELNWALVAAPLLLGATCAGFSGIATVLRAPAIGQKWREVASSEWVARARHAAADILSHPLLLKAKIGVRAYWKRARPALEAKFLGFLKLVGGNSRTSNLKAAIGAAALLTLYTIGTCMIWTSHLSHGQAAVSAVPSEIPSLFRPFVFLHVPGSGGVAWRAALNHDVSRLHVPRFMPCFGGLKCAINTDSEFNRTFISEQSHASQLTILQREMRCASVIAGHFKVSLLGVLASLDRVSPLNACPSRGWGSTSQHNLVIVLRHPLQRIISHYYRFGQTGPYKGRPFGNLTAMEVQVFLKQSGENLVMSYLTSAKINEFPSIVDATKNAVTNLQKCTVGIFEYWDETAEVIRSVAGPWLTAPLKALQTHPGREFPYEIEPMVQGILINRLVAEMRLYEVGFKRFKKQTQALPSLEKFAPKADSSFDPKDDNYYRHFVPEPFPFK